MQVFNASTGKFLCHNKYYGRGLTTEGFSTAIEKFLNNSDKPELIVIFCAQNSLFNIFKVILFYREWILLTN